MKEEGVKLFSVVPTERTEGNGHKLKHRKSCLNIRKNLVMGAICYCMFFLVLKFESIVGTL